MDSFYVEPSDLRVEHYLGCSEPFVADQDLSSIWELVVLLARVRCLCLLDGLVKVIDDVAHLLLDVSDDLELGVCGERVASLVQDLLEVFSDVITSQVDSLNGMRYSVTFIDWHGMRNTIAGIKDNTGGSTIGVEGEN